MNKEETILYIGGFELPDKNAAAQRVIANGKLLRDLGYNVVFDGVAKERIEGTDLSISRRYFNFESFAQKYPSSFFRWIEYTVELDRYVKLISKYENIKAVIGYNLPAVSLYRLLRYCRRNKIKLISDCTEWYASPKWGNYIRKFVKRKDIFLRMEVINPKTDGVISISEYLNNFYLKKGVKSVKIPPLVDLDDPKWKRSLTKTNNVVEVLYAGSPFFQHRKSNAKDRLDVIIRSFAMLKKEAYKFKFHVAGISKSSLVSFFPYLVEDVAFLGESIEFHGRLSHEETIALLKKSDYSIFLRDINRVTQAGFPTKFVESISCGTPVLTNKNSNIKEFLIEGTNGYWIDMSSDYRIKESIAKAISVNSDCIMEMKRSCLISKVFDYRNYLEEVHNLLES